MKKIIITAVALAFSSIALAQAPKSDTTKATPATPATPATGYTLTDDGFVEVVLPDRGTAVSLVVDGARSGTAMSPER